MLFFKKILQARSLCAIISATALTLPLLFCPFVASASDNNPENDTNTILVNTINVTETQTSPGSTGSTTTTTEPADTTAANTVTSVTTAETTPMDTTTPVASDATYKYAITVEFGALTFYYDYGTWNTTQMRYVSGEASSSPAAGTNNGFPGWYGFDGTVNKISIKYTNNNENDISANQGIQVSFSYRALTNDESGTVISGVSMQLYGDKALTQSISETVTVPHTALDSDEKTVVYVSLVGIPQFADSGENYHSTSFSPVGLLTMQIGDFSD